MYLDTYNTIMTQSFKYIYITKLTFNTFHSGEGGLVRVEKEMFTQVKYNLLFMTSLLLKY